MDSSGEDQFTGTWAWLFPTTYLVHIAEEYWAPPGFVAWVSELAGIVFTARVFLVANGLFFVLMAAAVWLVLRRVWPPWVLLAPATLVAINGLLHMLGTALSGVYSPGLVSGVLLWLPLGIVTLVRGKRVLGRQPLRRGVVAGVLTHLAVPAVGVVLSGLLGS